MMRRLTGKGKKAIGITATAMTVMGSGAMAWAGWGGHHGGNGGFAHAQHMNMTAEDYSAAAEIHEKFLAETGEIRRALMEKEAAIRAGLAGEKPDLARMKGLQKEIAALRGQLDEKRLVRMVEMKEKVPGYNGGYDNYCGYGAGHGNGAYHGHNGGHY